MNSFVTLSAEWIDIGTNYLAVLSPVQCAASKGTTAITNASVLYYRLDTVADLDNDLNGYVDTTENVDTNGDLVIDAADKTAVNFVKGWTC